MKKKFLVIRFSSIGDIVLTSPVVRCLKNQIPDCEVHFLTKSVFRELVIHNTNIDKCFFLENSLNKITAELRKENYDAVIDLHHNLRTLKVKRDLNKMNFSFPKLNFEKWLLVNFHIYRLPNKHIVDRYFETVKSLGVSNDGAGLDYFIPEKDKVDLNSISLERGDYTAFAIGGKFATKKLPIEKLISVCKKIVGSIILLGGKEDFAEGEKIREAIGSRVINGCGSYSLNQSASLLEQSKIVITHDTGLMHIAAALKKEVVSIWGNTIPGFGMTPYYGNVSVKNKSFEVPNLSCRPCSKIGFGKCPKGHFKCMNDQDEMEIAKAANA